MAWLAVDKDGREFIHEECPGKDDDAGQYVDYSYYGGYVLLPYGTIEKLIGRKLTWEDEPVELTEEVMTTKIIIDDKKMKMVECCSRWVTNGYNFCPKCGKRIIKTTES
jgi:hypothetical protein